MTTCDHNKFYLTSFGVWRISRFFSFFYKLISHLFLANNKKNEQDDLIIQVLGIVFVYYKIERNNLNILTYSGS